MELRLTSALVFGLAACFPACSSPAEGPVMGAGGSSAGSGGSTSGAAGSAGQAPVSGAAGSAAHAGSGGTSGVSGSAGAGAGGSLGGGGAGGEATGGMTFWGPGGPKKQWECPAGPFPAQQMGQSTDICKDGFTFNYGYNEGPTWIAKAGAFFFTNFIQGSDKGGDIVKYTPGGQCEVWLHEVGCNGLGVSPSGNLLGACHGPRAVMEYDVTSKQGRMVATTVNGKMLDSPNDLIARGDGNVYFSNTTYELGDRPAGLGFGLVRIDPMGVTSLIEGGNLNGIALSPDENKLHVVGKGTWTLDAMGVAGQKGGPSPGGDGIAVDCAGNISNNGTNSAYGGVDGKTLIIVGGGTNARTVQMTVPGLP